MGRFNAAPMQSRSLHARKTDGSFKHRPYDERKLRITLKQWRIFHAVHDSGGFTEAGAQLHLSQSTISYAIAKLQDQLGVTVFRIEGRKAILTAAGRVILQRSRQVLKEAHELEAFAAGLLRGHAPHAYLILDGEFPRTLLTRALHAFSIMEPDTALFLTTCGLSQNQAVLDEHPLSLAVTRRAPDGCVSEPFITLRYLAIAHAGHPLSRYGCRLSPSDLRRHAQIVVGEPSAEAGQFGHDTHDMRPVPDLEAAVNAVRAGAGYAWLPECVVDTCQGRANLKVLDLKDGLRHARQFHLVRQAGLAHNALPVRLSELLKTEVTQPTPSDTLHTVHTPL